jgi:uncharacterized protein
MPTVEEARSWYPEDPVHGFDHILRVYRMAGYLARAEGGDLEVVQAAALLHDAQGSETAGGEAGRSAHHHQSATFAREVLESEGWQDDRITAVQHCIRAHRFRADEEPPKTLEAKIVFDADKLDVIGAIGVVRTLAYTVTVGQPIYIQPSDHFLQTGEKEPGEAHSSYHEYLFKLKKVRDMLHTPTARRLAEGRHAFLGQFFEQLGAELRGDR